MSRLLPTPRQLEFQDWEFGIFIHFGIRTFYEGRADWDENPMRAEAFHPTALDCDQWAQTAVKAGARYMVFVAKHHDGFATWPSKYTEFCVRNSPWKDGKGDVVREYTDACRRHGLKVGIYYSPAEHGSMFNDSAKDYDQYFINQIGELLTGYGQVDMLWFDGCGSENHTYDWTRIIGEIRRMQPQILLFNMGDPDYRWVGNECGIAPMPCWNITDEVNISIRTENTEDVGTKRWLPAECDCRMRRASWFYVDDDEDTVKSVDELMGLYYYSVGRGANLLLNIGPDRRGLLPDVDTMRLLEMGKEIRRRFDAPVARMEAFTQTKTEAGTEWTIHFDEPTLVDHCILQEKIAEGERIRRVCIEAVPPICCHKPGYLIWEGPQVGHKAICRFPTMMMTQLTVRVLESDGEPLLSGIELFHTGG